jgi:hypothetical protein
MLTPCPFGASAAQPAVWRLSARWRRPDLADASSSARRHGKLDGHGPYVTKPLQRIRRFCDQTLGKSFSPAI